MFEPKWKFDFKVTIEDHVVTAMPGQAIEIPVKVELIRGKPQPVALNVNTHWESAGLTAQIIPSMLTPNPEGSRANMIIRVSGSTKPGSYLFTVRGEIKGTFSTSEDAVTVIVESEGKQKSDKQDSSQYGQSQDIAEPSFDLDKLFLPKNEGQIPAVKEGGIKNPAGNSTSVWVVFGVIMGLVIFFIILAANGVFDGGGGGGGGSGCQTTCPGGIGIHTPKSCKCPSACPYTYIADVGGGYKECASIPAR